MHSGLFEVEACQCPTGGVRAWELLLSLPGPVPSLPSHPCWLQCSWLQEGASATLVAVALTLPPHAAWDVKASK